MEATALSGRKESAARFVSDFVVSDVLRREAGRRLSLGVGFCKLIGLLLKLPVIRHSE